MIPSQIIIKFVIIMMETLSDFCMIFRETLEKSRELIKAS